MVAVYQERRTKYPLENTEEIVGPTYINPAETGFFFGRVNKTKKEVN
jgi:hypothetical protein